ncbi:MAG: minor capsid protein [Betaproteobacteria bacterium]|nr:minor capsid protein [Betaproteobacteria bacterium]
MISISFRLPFSQAVAAARRRNVMLPADYYALPAEYRRQAFTVTGLATLDQIQRVRDSLTAAIGDGQTFMEWKKGLDVTALALPRARLDLIYRQAAQTAYMAGHQRTLEGNTDRRPFWMYSAINDHRTRPTHRAMSGFVARHDDPVWKRWFPPCAFNCRCTIVSLTEEQAKRRGYPMARPPVEPDPGFRNAPLDEGEKLDQLLRDRVLVAGGVFAVAYERAVARMLAPDWLPSASLLEGEIALLAAMRGDPRYAVLTPAEVYSIGAYTGSSFSWLNEHLRGNVEELSAIQIGMVQSLGSAVRKLEQGVERTLWRGFTVDEGRHAGLRGKFVRGEVGESEAFLSTSDSQVIATARARPAGRLRGVLIEIRTSRGADVHDFVDLQEGEIIIAPQARFLVVSVREEGGILYVQLRDAAGQAGFGFSA